LFGILAEKNNNNNMMFLDADMLVTRILNYSLTSKTSQWTDFTQLLTSTS